MRDAVHQFLEKKFLYWLEALGILGRASESIGLIAAVKSVNFTNSELPVQDLLYDVERSALMYSSMADTAPLQLYCSAITFAPESSITQKPFQSCVPKWRGRLPQRSKVWNAAYLVLDGYCGIINTVAFFPDGKRLVSGADDDIWNAESGIIEYILQDHGRVPSVAVSPDSKHLISTSFEGSIKIRDAFTGELIHTVSFKKAPALGDKFILQGPGATAFSLDGQFAAWASSTSDLEENGDIQIWGLVERSSKNVIKCKDSMQSLVFAPNGSDLAAGYHNGIIKIWGYLTGECKKILTSMGDLMAISSVSYSPDGELLASGSNDIGIRLWSLKTNTSVRILDDNKSTGSSIAFSPNSKTLVCGSSEIYIWDLVTERHLHTLIGHTGWVTSICFSLFGAQMASSSYDGTIRIWDMSSLITGKNADDLSTRLSQIKFSPDGAFLATTSEGEGTISLWATINSKVITKIAYHPLTSGPSLSEIYG